MKIEEIPGNWIHLVISEHTEYDDGKPDSDKHCHGLVLGRETEDRAAVGDDLHHGEEAVQEEAQSKTHGDQVKHIHGAFVNQMDNFFWLTRAQSTLRHLITGGK